MGVGVMVLVGADSSTSEMEGAVGEGGWVVRKAKMRIAPQMMNPPKNVTNNTMNSISVVKSLRHRLGGWIWEGTGAARSGEWGDVIEQERGQ